MLDEKLYIKTIKSLLLTVLTSQESIAALAATLSESKHLDPVKWQAKLTQLQELNKARREQIESIGENDLEAFLRQYEGPIQ